jgi:hypothetical protein
MQTKNYVTVNLSTAAIALDVRKDELEVYVEDNLNEKKWLGFFDDAGKQHAVCFLSFECTRALIVAFIGNFIYLCPTRVAQIRAILEQEGRVTKERAKQFLLGIDI